MAEAVDPRYFFNSRQHSAPRTSFSGAWIDLASDPSSAHELIRLGVSPRRDLPALTLAEPGGRLVLLGTRLTPGEAERLADGSRAPLGGSVARAGEGPAVLYGAAWCWDCEKLRELLERRGRAFEEVNVDHDATAEALVLARSGGRRVTPTLVLDDRIWLFNPPERLVERFLGAG
jgi:mycoredoxin